MSQNIKPNLKIGILGGGQLARMLALSAHNLGVIPVILSTSKDDPAQQVVQQGVIGNPNDEKTVQTFASTVDLLTFESEFINADMLESAVKNHNNKIFPHISVIRTLQDRKTQKSILEKYKIPSAPWMVLENEASVIDLSKSWSFPFVIKKRRNGYDGYGTYIIKNPKMVDEFLENSFNQPEGFIAEKFIKFKRELACIFSRNRSGDILQYPLVESFQKEARCFWVKGPIKHPQFLAWSKKFKRFLDEIDYVGTIGVELFDDGKNLFVNELAPRVHNTGHYSIDTLGISQFEAHLRAILDMQLPSTLPETRGFAMINLLGGTDGLTPSWKLSKDTHLHWYGKKETRKGRKMGHFTVLDKTPAGALKKGLQALKGFKV